VEHDRQIHLYTYDQVEWCVFELKCLTINQKRIFLYLVYYKLRLDPDCAVSHNKLSKDLAISEGTIVNSLRKLQHLGCLDWVRPDNGPFRYLLRINQLPILLRIQQRTA